MIAGNADPSVTVTNSSPLNNTAKCNNIGIVVAGVGTTNNLVQHNKALNNSFFGILDVSCDSNTLPITLAIRTQPASVAHSHVAQAL